MTHTPGPWAISKRNHAPGEPEPAVEIHNGNRLVADVFHGDNKAEANARLIASAPDLLETLEEITEAYTAASKGDTKTYDYWHVSTKAKEAIMLAKGE